MSYDHVLNTQHGRSINEVREPIEIAYDHMIMLVLHDPTYIIFNLDLWTKLSYKQIWWICVVN